MIVTPSYYASLLLLWGIVAHIVADWFFQNSWMALNKVKITHPAAWVHGGIHFVALCFVFHWQVALVLALVHIAIDTRKPLQWWRQFYRQTTDPSNPVFVPFAMWQDQCAHIVTIAIAALVVGGAR